METQLKEFFSRYPHSLQLVTEGYPCHNPDHVEVWENLFVYIYNEAPVDVVCTQHPLYRRPGSTDPRWDELIHERGCLRILRDFLHAYINGDITIAPSTKEAA